VVLTRCSDDFDLQLLDSDFAFNFDFGKGMGLRPRRIRLSRPLNAQAWPTMGHHEEGMAERVKVSRYGVKGGERLMRWGRGGRS
jgi:hypothetical protein